ncbi:MAG: hypothetical protein PHW76_02955 [Alphaproteobacteria bacterium]|nr:hypothetical protein [Alphaproteobacteria bacterium]
MNTKTFFTKMLDSRKNEVEAHLVLLCLGACALIGLSIYHVVGLKLAFDASNFGQGLGLLLAGGGAAAWGQGLQRGHERIKDNDPYQ